MNNKAWAYVLGTVFNALVFSGAAEASQAKPEPTAKTQKKPEPKASKSKSPAPLTPEQFWFNRCGNVKPEREAYSVIDAATGNTLLSRHDDVGVRIASLTKIMTLILASEAIDDGLLTEASPVKVETSWNINQKGQRITKVLTGWLGPQPLGNLMIAAATESKNDAAVSIAMAVAKAREWGIAEADFVREMNQKAKTMGFDMIFPNATGLPIEEVNATGLPLGQIEPHAKLRDVSKLFKIVLDHHPRVAGMLGIKETMFGKEKYEHILRRVFDFNLPGFSANAAATAKSGMTCLSGYAAAVAYDDIIVTYVGAKTAKQREDATKNLLQQGHAMRELKRSLESEHGPR